MNQAEADPCQELDSFKRNRYFTGKVLTENDFNQEQLYFRTKNQHHNRYFHGSGTVCGLRVSPPRDDARDHVIVEPGLAIDPWGREVLLPESKKLEISRQDNRDGRSMYVVLEYYEYTDGPMPVPGGPQEEEITEPARIIETCKLSVRTKPPETSQPFKKKLFKQFKKAARKKLDPEKIHALLCELVIQPCQPCAPDPALTLAKVRIPKRRPITTDDIDNCGYRLLAISNILQSLLS